MEYELVEIKQSVTEIAPVENFSHISYSDFIREVHDVIASSKVLLVDMSNVVYINSLGLSVLVNFHQTARNQGVKFILHSLGETVNQVITLSNLDKFFTLAENRRDALKLAEETSSINEE